MLLDGSRTICGSVRVRVCDVCVFVLDASLALALRKTGRFLPLAPSPFSPLIVASWVAADSSSCLLPLIYQARADKCKHLPRYPPNLGARGGWMCSIFLFIPIWWINELFSPGCLSSPPSVWSSPLLSFFHTSPPNTISSSVPGNRCGLKLC